MRGGFPRRIRGAGGHTAPRASHGDRFARASRVRRASSSDALPRFGRAFSRRLAEGASTARSWASDFGEAGWVGTEETSSGAMFYSQYILAKRGPLGTIWIAAHLDRRLRKQQITETDVAQAVRECPDPASRPVPWDARPPRVPILARRARPASRSTSLPETFARARTRAMWHTSASRARPSRASRASRGSRDDDFFFPSRLLATVGRRRAALRSSARRPVPRPSSFPPRSLFFPHPSLFSQSPSSTRMPPWRSVFPASSCSASSASTAAR